MDPQSRKTASTYINNLLLSRGLLRNGNPIDFAEPEKAEGGVDATMAQAMNLVHDFILRRDREADTLASLSQNLQSLRTTSAQHTQNITRLEVRNADLDRQVALTAAQERAARATLKSAETRNKALREDISRLKGSVTQIRAQCAADVRRRDGEIQRLKRHVEGRRGRDGTSGQVGVVLVTPGLTKGTDGTRSRDAEIDLESPAYSLKQETTEFLTQLSQGLSDENDALIGLVKGTLATLRSLQGLPDSAQSSEVDTYGGVLVDVNGPIGGPPSYEQLAASTDEVLEHLRGLLTNPSFVPLEEVEIREEEIHRLRDGWEKMAARWKEAMALLDGWKKRMLDTGDTINLNDLKIGMQLGSELPTVEQAREDSMLRPDEEANANESDIIRDLQDNAEDPSSPEVEEVKEIDLEVSKTDKALSNRDVNVRHDSSPRKVAFQPIDQENTGQSGKHDDLSLLDFSSFKAPQKSPSKARSRIPLQATEPTAPSQTVQQKLDRAKAEAEEAKRREESETKTKSVAKRQVTKKLRGSRRRSTLSPEELMNLIGIS